MEYWNTKNTRVTTRMQARSTTPKSGEAISLIKKKMRMKRFDICYRANGWDETTQALKLPTLLEGEALAIWLELTVEQQVYINGILEHKEHKSHYTAMLRIIS